MRNFGRSITNPCKYTNASTVRASRQVLETRLKSALDGGLDIPHSDKRFAGFKKENKQLDAGVHRKYVYGGHVAAYMMMLIEDELEKYQTHFSEYIKKGIEADGIEELYRKVHAGIRADPIA
ncbi:hypothetical protein IFM89_019521 [Coptis chinensis]|uniref:60S ribosomal protein L5 n=1 Tax=Coptis chinensis TaxID=261450 RepID=A0A835HZS3_9MAGN|nr:hypothetical protein IFM89_019521 [Coptis chinensis]